MRNIYFCQKIINTKREEVKANRLIYEKLGEFQEKLESKIDIIWNILFHSHTEVINENNINLSNRVTPSFPSFPFPLHNYQRKLGMYMIKPTGEKEELEYQQSRTIRRQYLSFSNLDSEGRKHLGPLWRRVVILQIGII